MVFDVDSERLERLLVGEDRRRTGTALLLAGALTVVCSTVGYLAFSYNVGAVDAPIFGYLRHSFVVVPLGDLGSAAPTWMFGYVLVIGLAAIHAFYNRGYLTSVLLASAPQIGTAFWSIHGMDEYVVLTPGLVFDRVFPEAPIIATLGFVLGLGLRAVAQKGPTPPAEPHIAER